MTNKITDYCFVDKDNLSAKMESLRDWFKDNHYLMKRLEKNGKGNEKMLTDVLEKITVTAKQRLKESGVLSVNQLRAITEETFETEASLHRNNFQYELGLVFGKRDLRCSADIDHGLKSPPAAFATADLGEGRTV